MDSTCLLLSMGRLGVVAAVVTVAACSKPEPAPEPIRAVRVLTVGTGSFLATTEYAAEVRPRVESRLGFRVAGKITKRQAEVGQRVKAGQLLAQLDPQDYKLATDAARAQVAAALTNRDLAAADFRRYKELQSQNFISGAEVERRETTLKAAQAQLDQAQAQLAAQSNQGSYTNLVADVSGVVTAVEAEPGQVVTAGTPIVRIAQDGPRDAVFSVPEDKVASMRMGSAVAVRLWATAGDMAGTVREVAASADPATRTYPVKVALAALPNAKDMPALGATVYVKPAALAHAGVQIIKLPTTALKQDGASTAVWLLDTTSMTVKSQPIQIATADGNDAVIAAGLKPGDLVVSAGVHVLNSGQKVSIYQEKTPQASANTSSVATKSVAPAAPAAAK